MKILNFGSLNIDYVYDVASIVKPGETVLSLNLQTFCGGKGLNQSIALSKAGAKVYHAGMVGKDSSILTKCLAEFGVDTSYVGITDTQTGHAIIQVDKKGENSIVVYGGANQEITCEFINEVLSHFDAGDFLLVQNEINNVDTIIKTAYNKGMKVVLNPSPINVGFDKEMCKYVTYFLLNEIEGKELSGATEPQDILDNMLQMFPDARIVLTLGKKGVVYRDRYKQVEHGIYDVSVVDTTAAGDTFSGYFIAYIAQGAEVEEALKWASIASSLAVSKKGASDSIPFRSEVENAQLIPI